MKPERILAKLDGCIHQWTDVAARPAFGGRCYLARDRLFAWCDGQGFINMKLTGKRRILALAADNVEPLRMGAHSADIWLRFRVRRSADLARALDFARESYEMAWDKPPKRAGSRGPAPRLGRQMRRQPRR